MRVKRKAFLAFTFAAIVLGLTLYVYANPGVAACAITDSNQEHSAVYEQLLMESSTRIKNTFGTLQSKPIVVFFNNRKMFWPLTLNEYGSTQFIGPKVCVMIGPKGQNLDVVAHELMHAEIADRVGYWGRLTQLPVWFDEGLAMQVDFRPRYVIRDVSGAEAEYVKTLLSAGEFFVQNDDLLTQNYAVAKAEVARWVEDVGGASVYSRLERIRAGESFHAISSQ